MRGPAPALGLALLLLGAVAGGCLPGRVRHPEALPHFAAMVTTDDGWQVAAFRVPPAAGTEDRAHHGTPVVLAHGTGVNRHEFLLPGRDLAAYLAAEGFDVWLAEYRGDRTSRAPDGATWRAGDWDVDDIAGHDLPALLRHVERVTGHRQVYYLGHSLGGIVGYLVAQGPDADRIAGLVAVGAPGSLEHPNDVALLTLRHRGLVPARGVLPTRGLTRLALPAVVGTPDTRLTRVILNPDNADVGQLAPSVADTMEDTSRGLAVQYLAWIEGGPLTSRDGTTDYTAGLARVTCPTLFVAGRVDHVVPAWTVRRAHDAVGSADRTLITLGVGWGTAEEYGHGDLIAGDRAAVEVFPRIAAWLAARAAPASAVAPGGGVQAGEQIGAGVPQEREPRPGVGD